MRSLNLFLLLFGIVIVTFIQQIPFINKCFYLNRISLFTVVDHKAFITDIHGRDIPLFFAPAKGFLDRDFNACVAFISPKTAVIGNYPFFCPNRCRRIHIRIIVFFRIGNLR